jgi:hypothetical protein
VVAVDVLQEDIPEVVVVEEFSDERQPEVVVEEFSNVRQLVIGRRIYFSTTMLL